MRRIKGACAIMVQPAPMTTRTNLAEAGSNARKAPLARALAGIVLIVVGAAALAGLVYISNSRDASAEHAMISLGLAGSVLVSAIAQGMVIIGLWMVWSARARRRPN